MLRYGFLFIVAIAAGAFCIPTQLCRSADLPFAEDDIMTPEELKIGTVYADRYSVNAIMYLGTTHLHGISKRYVFWKPEIQCAVWFVSSEISIRIRETTKPSGLSVYLHELHEYYQN